MAKLKLLGGFGLERSDRGEVPVSTLKGRSLLAYLACAKGRIASRDSLALLLWSDSDSRKSKQNLRQVLHKLSRILAEHDLPILRADAQSIALRTEDIWVDTWELESLADAESLPALRRVASLYRDEFLQGLALDAPVFGDWLADTRAYFQSRALNCLHAMLARQRDAGDLRAAIATGLRVLEIDSTQEHVHRALMELYLDSGMRPAALNQYRVCRTILRRDLDVVPDKTTEALYRRIREQTEDTRPNRRGILVAARSGLRDDGPETQGGEGIEPPIGRAAESAVLHDALTQVRVRGARLLALCGEAGIGKTYLLDTFTKQLDRRGVLVCRAIARQAESRLPLGPWRQVLDALLPPIESAGGQLPARVQEVSAPYGAPFGDTVDSPFRVHGHDDMSFDEVLDCLRNRAVQGPLVLILEDVQWADTESLHFLSRAIHSLGHAPVLFITTARLLPEPEPAQLTLVLRDLDRAGLARHCELHPLPFDDSMALVNKALATSGFPSLRSRDKRRLCKIAEGNPEILIAGLAPAVRIDTLPLPQNMRHGAREIVDRISPAAKNLLRLVSLGRGSLGFPICARAGALKPRRATAALEELTAANLLREAGGKLAMARAWLGKAILDDVSAHRRQAMHVSITQAIRELEAPDLVPHFGALAHHSQAAGEKVAAAEYRLFDTELLRASGARRAASKALNDLARKLPERPHDPRLDAVCWRARFLYAAVAEAGADLKSALYHLRALERRGPNRGDPRAAAALPYALSRALCMVGDGGEGLRYARRALRLSTAQGGAGGPWSLAERLLFRCHLPASAVNDVISNLKVRAGLSCRRKLWSAVGEIAAAQATMESLNGEVAAMSKSLRAAREAIARLREPRLEASVLQIEGMVRTWVGDGHRAIEALSAALAMADTAGDLIRACVVRGLRGRARFAHGLLGEAESDFKQAISAAAALGSVPYLPLFYGGLAEVAGRRGQRDGALKHARHAWHLSRRQGQAWNRAPILCALARALTHARRPDIAAAERAARDAIAVQRAAGIRIGLANSHEVLAEVRRAAGDLAGSGALLRQAQELRHRMGI